MHLQATHISNARAKSSDDGRTLLFSKLGLSVIPSSVLADLERVERLALSNNLLTDIPSDFTRLSHLRYLNLKGNRLTVLPDALASLPSLDTLDVSNNKITKFMDDPGELITLTTLILTRNLLTSLPAYISKFEELRNLHVDRNPLEWPPKAVIDVPSKKDSDEGMADWVRSLQMWMDADFAQNGLYSGRRDEIDADKDLANSLEDSFNSWSRFGGSGISRRSSHHRGSSASSGTSLQLSRTVSHTSNSDFGFDSSPMAMIRNGLNAPHSRTFSIDSSFSIDSIAESEFEDVDHDLDISITANDSDDLDLDYRQPNGKLKRHAGLHRHGPSFASSISNEPAEMHKEDHVLAPSLHLGILQSYSTEVSPTRSLFERDARESYLPSPSHSDDRGFFEDDASSVIVREGHNSGVTDSSSTSTLNADQGDSHARNRSFARQGRPGERSSGYTAYGSNSLAKKSLPDLRTAKLNFSKRNGQEEPSPVPSTSQHRSSTSITLLKRQSRGPSSANGADEEFGIPSPLSTRQDSGSTSSAGSASGRSFSGGIRPLFAGTGRTFEPSATSPTRAPTVANGAINLPHMRPASPPPQSSGDLHHTPSMASQRNSYFRRLSTLPGHSRTLPAPLLILVDSARSILFSLSQIFQGLEAFVLNEATPAPPNDPFGSIGGDGDRVTLILRKVLGPASLDLKSLISSLSHFDDVWAKRTIPSPRVCRTVVETCKDAVAAFRKVVNVLALQLPILFSSVETQPGKNGAEDARFQRGLLLLLYGAMSEIAGAWARLCPVAEGLQPLIQEPHKSIPAHPQQFDNYSLTSTPANNRVAASKPKSSSANRPPPPQRPSLTHVARRNAGSFSIQDVEMGKIMPEIEEPHSGLSPVLNATSRATLRAPKRKAGAAGSSGGNPFANGAPWSGGKGESDAGFGARGFSHSREGSQASGHSNSAASSPLLPGKGYPTHLLLDPSTASGKGSFSTVDKSALMCVREVLEVAAVVWDGLEEVLVGNVDELEEKQVRENLIAGRAITRRLAEIVSPMAGEASLQGLGDDAKLLLKTIIHLSQVYKTRFGNYTPDEALRMKLAQLSNSATELAIFLRVASFTSGSNSSLAPRVYSPHSSAGTPSPGITTTIAPPTPLSGGSLYSAPSSSASSSSSYSVSPSPRSPDEPSRQRAGDPPGSARSGLSRSRSAQAQATSSPHAGIPLEDPPRSAHPSHPSQTFYIPVPPSPMQRRREVAIGDPG